MPLNDDDKRWIEQALDDRAGKPIHDAHAAVDRNTVTLLDAIRALAQGDGASAAAIADELAERLKA